MNAFIDYQRMARETAVYPGKGTVAGLTYVTLGLCGEAGEVAEKVKKILRDDNGIVTKEKRQALAKELGDVLWYLSQVALELDLPLNYIATQNLNKLNARKVEGKLKGSGDNR